MAALELPQPRTSSLVGCARTGCRALGLAEHRRDPDSGDMTPTAPEGWQQVDAVTSDGGTWLVLFVCSTSCARQLAHRVEAPRLGSLDG